MTPTFDRVDVSMEKLMPRMGFPAAIWLGVLLGALFGPWAGCSWAAPPVQRLFRPQVGNPYPKAADELGFRDWGGGASTTPLIRVTVRLDAERFVLSVELPPNTSLPTAETWLQGLSEAMGWQDVTLRSNAQPETLYLRAEV